MAAAPGWRQLLMLSAAAAVFAYPGLIFRAPGATFVLVAFDALKLWLLSWVGSLLDPALQISGFWTFVGTAFFTVVLTGPIRVIDRWRDRSRWQDPFPDTSAAPPVPPSSHLL